LPSFVVGPLLALTFGLHLRWLPVAGWESGQWRYLVLPVITLALPVIAYIARLTRGSLLEVLRSNFVRTARSKGLSERAILWRHALRPAMLPVVSYLGPATAFVITGSLVVETVFGLPGSGRYLVQGAINRDYTLVMGMIVVYGSVTLLFNLIADLLYGWLDPRVRYD
jgi:oligopeptide transport system permease protein